MYLDVYAMLTHGSTCLIHVVGLTHHLLPYSVYSSSQGSNETGRMRRLFFSLGGRPCEKYQPPPLKRFDGFILNKIQWANFLARVSSLDVDLY